MEKNAQDTVEVDATVATEESTQEAVSQETPSVEERLAAIEAENGILRRQNTKFKKALESDEEKSESEENINNTKDDLTQRLTRLEEEREILRRGYTPEQADWLLKRGGLADLEDPVIAKALESYGKQTKAEGATDFVVKAKAGDGTKGYTQEELRNMSSEDLEKILPKA